jgi:hypothetical protein
VLQTLSEINVNLEDFIMTGFDYGSGIFEFIKMNGYVKSVMDNPGEDKTI